MTDLFGQAVVHASRSAPQVPSVAQRMSATYGLRSSTSSASAALQQSLANRLRERLDSRGSIMFALTWKAKATPLRRQICQLAASALRTDGSDCSGWPTPTTQAKDWSEEAADAWARGERNTTHHLDLGGAVQLAAWPTPQAHDVSGRSETQKEKHGTKHGCSCLVLSARMAGWATPGAKDGDKSVRTPEGAAKEAQRRGWQNDLCTNAMTTLGATSNGSPAQTEKRGQLNPAFSRWLQGYPKEYCEAAIAAHRQMQTTRLKRGSED